MLVLDHAVVGELAILPAGTDDRNFFLKIDESLEHAFLPIERGEGGFDIVRRSEVRLALAVGAEAGRLQHAGESEILRAAIKIVDQLDMAKGRDGKAVVGEKGLFSKAVLCRVKNVASRMDRDDLCSGVDAGRRDVLKFEGDD